MTLTSYSGDLSRFYVSGAAEATAGISTTLNKSWRIKGCSLQLKEVASVDDVVSGYAEPATITRERLQAEGDIDAFLQPDLMAWMLKILFGTSDSSALVSPSTTVYEHIWYGIPVTPNYFSLMKQLASISTYTETYAGNAIKSFTVKSGKGKVTLSIKLVGLGVLTKGTSAPATSVTVETFMTGAKTNVLVAGSQLTAGKALVDWSVTVDTGYELTDAAGSTDGTGVRVDQGGLPKYTASLTIPEVDRSNLDAFTAETIQSYEFTCDGAAADTPNSLNYLVGLKLMKARQVGAFASEIGKHGLYTVGLKLEGLVDTAEGYAFSARVRDLSATH
jgi:hypothetical protein